ncbi:MAG: hypothetical protein US67_C0037G0004 [Candidatus Woesebacteria bacterium GW2011_GWD1_38_10]|uniref:Uncharacterized protein n=1 Tax=Candidatus Woesebacteria bacterium GW2011_GWD1_38_10 TaxID=1618592 RepID=A0A0G0HYY3_9BACT|nr:MAG: hypothetical protein US67_C0037G0004 [Candidatus Woesebacteria bacterium GW2011_GWD1_38_10]
MSVANIKLTENASKSVRLMNNNFLKLTPLRIWGKTRSVPNPTIDEKLITKPITSGLLNEFSIRPGTQEERIASARNAKKRIRESVVIFCQKGSEISEEFRRLNIAIHNSINRIVSNICKYFCRSSCQMKIFILISHHKWKKSKLLR